MSELVVFIVSLFVLLDLAVKPATKPPEPPKTPSAVTVETTEIVER